MARAQDIDQAIIQELKAFGVCQVDDVVERLTGFTWNQVFAAIDRLSRSGRLALQRPGRFGYEISIIPGQNRMLEAEVSR